MKFSGSHLTMSEKNLYCDFLLPAIHLSASMISLDDTNEVSCELLTCDLCEFGAKIKYKVNLSIRKHTGIFSFDLDEYTTEYECKLNILILDQTCDLCDYLCDYSTKRDYKIILFDICDYSTKYEYNKILFIRKHAGRFSCCSCDLCGYTTQYHFKLVIYA